MLTLKSLYNLSASHCYKIPINSTKPFFFFSSVAKSPNPSFVNYLIKTLNFSQSHALYIATRFSHIKSLKKPQSLVNYFQSLGFSNTHIRDSVHGCPQILLADIDKTLKPKIELFQQLGLKSCDLGKFISKASTLLTVSFDKKLVPCIEILRKVLINDVNNEHLFKILRKCSWIVCVNTHSRLLSNIAFLKNCGIVGSQLAYLLKRQPRLFLMQESAIRDMVSKVCNMGFPLNSRMFVYGLHSVSGLSVETFERKFKVFKSFGFSKDEYMEMVRKAPTLLRNSKEKSRLGIDFYLNTVKFKKEVLFRRPGILLYSFEDRVIPRYRVLEILKSKMLLKKDSSFLNVLDLTEEEFMEKYVSRSSDHTLELLVAYKGHLLDSSCEEESHDKVSVPLLNLKYHQKLDNEISMTELMGF